MARRLVYIAVVGPGEADPATADLAAEVGRHVARAGAVMVCGGLGGVMEAACRGAEAAGGLTVGLLPGLDRSAANPFVQVAIPTGLGEARNALVVRSADALVAIGGGYGTLSEIALALRSGRPVVGVGTWVLQPPEGGLDQSVQRAAGGAEAVSTALRLVRQCLGPGDETPSG